MSPESNTHTLDFIYLGVIGGMCLGHCLTCALHLRQKTGENVLTSFREKQIRSNHSHYAFRDVHTSLCHFRKQKAMQIINKLILISKTGKQSWVLVYI